MEMMHEAEIQGHIEHLEQSAKIAQSASECVTHTLDMLEEEMEQAIDVDEERVDLLDELGEFGEDLSNHLVNLQHSLLECRDIYSDYVKQWKRVFGGESEGSEDGD